MAGERASSPLLAQGYITEEDAAEQFGIKRQSLVNMRRAGIGPPNVEWARRFYYHPDHYVAWVTSKEGQDAISRGHRRRAHVTRDPNRRGPGRPRKVPAPPAPPG